MHDYSSAYRGEFSARRGKRRFDDDEPTTAKRVRRRQALPSLSAFDATEGWRTAIAGPPGTRRKI